MNKSTLTLVTKGKIGVKKKTKHETEISLDKGFFFFSILVKYKENKKQQAFLQTCPCQYRLNNPGDVNKYSET